MLTLSFGRQDKTSFLSSLRELPVAELHRLVQQRPDILLKLRVLVLELGCEEKCSRGPTCFFEFHLESLLAIEQAGVHDNQTKSSRKKPGPFRHVGASPWHQCRAVPTWSASSGFPLPSPRLSCCRLKRTNQCQVPSWLPLTKNNNH